jgi:putative SOS response-associated peptidase YedK
MCGRTALTTPPEDLREAFGLDEMPELRPHYNVPPSQPLAVVRVLRRDPHRKMDLLRWGLVPLWAKDPKVGHKLTLARVETAATAPAYRDALKRRRCLVVVDGFFEWKRADGTTSARGATVRGARRGAAKSQPFFVHKGDGKPFALAGIWERWVSADGEVVESCAILTQPSRPPVDAIHDRMPLVLEKGAWDRWLDPALVDADALASFLEPKSPALVAYAVSSHVNDPRHDDATCLEPQAAPPQQLQAPERPEPRREPPAPRQGSLFPDYFGGQASGAKHGK